MGYVIGSRKSDLARLQAFMCAQALTEAFPDIQIEHDFRASLGDINQDDPLWKMPDKGVFTQDFHSGLLEGRYDMVVHSWKDLPIDQPKGTSIVATMPRADMRDMLFVKKETWQRVLDTQSLRVLTSSPRRAHNLEPFFKSHLPGNIDTVGFKDVRGNVPTRIQKMIDDSEVDGLILAKAAWDRLMLAPQSEFAPLQEQMSAWLPLFRWMVLPLKMNPCAAAQGALAIEIRSDRHDVAKILKAIHCEQTWQAVNKERQILKSHGGGCHQKIGCAVLSRPYGQLTFLRGQTEAGLNLSGHDLVPRDSDGATGAPRYSKAESYPHLGTHRGGAGGPKAPWFQRETLKVSAPNPESHHFVARALALPGGTDLPEGRCLWTSGLKTWQQLAQRGYWVHGSCESLGEVEDFRLESLGVGGSWVKWTHSGGARSAKFTNLSSYKLVEAPEAPNLDGVHNFFWMSGSAFLRAASTAPKILAANHYCGPGHTFSVISEALKDHPGTVRIMLDYDDWVAQTWKG